jgi:hypothetical protein
MAKYLLIALISLSFFAPGQRHVIAVEPQAVLSPAGMTDTLPFTIARADLDQLELLIPGDRIHYPAGEGSYVAFRSPLLRKTTHLIPAGMTWLAPASYLTSAPTPIYTHRDSISYIPFYFGRDAEQTIFTRWRPRDDSLCYAGHLANLLYTKYAYAEIQQILPYGDHHLIQGKTTGGEGGEWWEQYWFGVFTGEDRFQVRQQYGKAWNLDGDMRYDEPRYAISLATTDTSFIVHTTEYHLTWQEHDQYRDTLRVIRHEPQIILFSDLAE